MKKKNIKRSPQWQQQKNGYMRHAVKTQTHTHRNREHNWRQAVEQYSATVFGRIQRIKTKQKEKRK